MFTVNHQQIQVTEADSLNNIMVKIQNISELTCYFHIDLKTLGPREKLPTLFNGYNAFRIHLQQRQ